MDSSSLVVPPLPPAHLIDAAEADIPEVLQWHLSPQNKRAVIFSTDPSVKDHIADWQGPVNLTAAKLLVSLMERGHGAAAAYWAFRKTVDDGRLIARPLPGTDPTSASAGHVLIAPTDLLWAWWRESSKTGDAAQLELLESPVPALTKEAVAVLCCLANRAPALLTLDDVTVASRYSRDTASNALNELIGQGIAHRPNGQRKGATITERGRKVAAQLRR